MLVLALDTTTREGSCAVARDGSVLREQASDPSRPQAARLPGELMALLTPDRIRLEAIDVYAVAVGPGSFTGLRVGIATMQGLAFARGRPLIGVTSFDALARIAAAEAATQGASRTAVWIDAWRGEVYAAAYEHGRLVEAPVVSPPEALLDTPARQPTLFIGDGALKYRDLIRSAWSGLARMATAPAPLMAGTVARLATEAVVAGHAPSAEAIRPLYVRRPDAERARDARAAR